MRIDRLVTAGPGGNVWLVGDDERVVVVDAGGDAAAILDGIGDRRLEGIVCAHGHHEHTAAAVDVAQATGAPVALHPADRALWDAVHPHRRPEIEMGHGDVLQMGGVQLQVWHTPGHSPGGVCLYVAEAGAIFTGDTLGKGGPGPTHGAPANLPVLIESIRRLLMYMPPPTVVHPAHGESTSVGDEASHVDEWARRKR